MNDTKKCKYCRTEIDAKAKICPVCLKKQGGKFSIIIVAFFILVLISLAVSSGIDSEVETTSTKNSDKISGKDDTALSLNVGDIIKANGIEITIKKIELTYDVLPDDTSGLYTHYASDKGNVYIHIDTDVKNTAKQNLPCDEIMSVTADYNNGYKYYSHVIPEDSVTGFTYSSITSIKPLKTLGVRFLIDCPDEVDKSDNPLILKFKIDGSNDIYRYNLK